MRAVTVDRRGRVAIRTIPAPAVGRREVQIAVETSGVGSWDGSMRPERGESFIVAGTDGAGRVSAVGKRVRRFKRGDRVYSYSYQNPRGGFHAECVLVDAKKVARVPRGLDTRSAGAVATIGLTALQGVDDALRLKKGETVIVHGASGGVGTLALQFAKWRGARVLATASGRDGVALARRLGADVAIDGKRADALAAARRFAPRGVDAVLAFAGGRELGRCLDAVRPGGRAAWPNGVEPAPRKRGGLRMKGYDAVSGVAELGRLNRAMEATKPAKIKVPIAKTYPIARAAAAYRHASGGHVVGKVALRIRR